MIMDEAGRCADQTPREASEARPPTATATVTANVSAPAFLSLLPLLVLQGPLLPLLLPGSLPFPPLLLRLLPPSPSPSPSSPFSYEHVLSFWALSPH